MIEMKRYKPRRSVAYRLGYATAIVWHRWMLQPTWARTMVYIVTGYAIGFSVSAWVA